MYQKEQDDKQASGRTVTYLNAKYKRLLKKVCKDREEKESFIVREILQDYLDKIKLP